MALDPFVKAWASQYYANSLGLAEIPSHISEEDIKSAYEVNFVTPAKQFMKVQNLSQSDAKLFLTELRSNKLYSALYVLPTLVVDPSFTDWRAALRSAVSEFNKRQVTYFGLFSGAKSCIVCYVDIDAGTILGSYPPIGTLYPLIPMNTKGVNGDVVSYLCKRNPVSMSEQEISAVEYLLQCQAISEDQLKTVMFFLPKRGTVLARATDMRDIPYQVRMIILDLPLASIKEHGGDVYSAARAYAVMQPDKYSEELQWLDNIVRPNAEISSGTELNDETVKAYLVEHYGMNPDFSIASLFSSPIRYMTDKALTSAIEEKGADSVVSAMVEDPDCITDTLDNLILHYCKEEGLDLRCTISQLLHYINYDVVISPPTLESALGDYIAEHPEFPRATTVEEILSGTPHKYVDDFDTCMEFLEGCDNIDVELKRAIRAALIDNTELKMPETSTEDIVDAISDRNLPDEVKMTLIGIVEGTITADELCKPTKASNRVLSVPEQNVRKAAEYLLNSFRDYLLDKDTDDKRIAGQTVLYAYLKILYAGRSSVDEDKEFLLKKAQECSDAHISSFIQEAANLL